MRTAKKQKNPRFFSKNKKVEDFLVKNKNYKEQKS